MTDVSHNRSIVVWDVPPAVVCGSPFSARLGVKCDAACIPEGWELTVRDHKGEIAVTARLDDAHWPGTESLYGIEVRLTAPDTEGLFTWEVLASSVRSVGTDEAAVPLEHDDARATFRVRTVAEAECRLTVTAVDRSSQEPVAGAKVVVHPFRAVTDTRGVAALDLPKGRYCLFVTGHDFFPLRLDGELLGDTDIRVELEQDLGPGDAELWS